MYDIFDRLEVIGRELSKKRTCLVTIALKLDEYKARLLARELELTPETGWEGKNAEERKTNCEKVLSKNRGIRALRTAIKHLERGKMLLSAEIEGMEDNRRALEYTAQAILKGIKSNLQI